MKELLYDFHIHSCLSPCGDDTFDPETIVACALAKELDCIALTDHNTCGNCENILWHARKTSITVLPGMELQTSEEIHAVCLFPALDDALRFDSYVRERLPVMENEASIFGNQIIKRSDKADKTEKQMLLVSSDISLYGLYELVESFNGIAIPAHIDRDSFSIKSAFGMLDKDMGFPLVEVFRDPTLAENAGIPYIRSSDAHNIDAFFDSEYHTLTASDNSPRAILEALRGMK